MKLEEDAPSMKELLQYSIFSSFFFFTSFVYLCLQQSLSRDYFLPKQGNEQLWVFDMGVSLSLYAYVRTCRNIIYR